jgi:hypothetical protein
VTRAPRKKPARKSARSTSGARKAPPKAKARAKKDAKKDAKKTAPKKAKAKAKPARAKASAKPRRSRERENPEAGSEVEIVAEDVEQSAKQFAYVLTPVEPQPFALGSISLPNPLIASRPPMAAAPSPFPARVQAPFAERAAGAGSCAQCDDAIARAAWQVVVTDDGATIHPGCAFAWMQEHLEDHVETEAWMSTLVEHLSENDRAELLAALDRD